MIMLDVFIRVQEYTILSEVDRRSSIILIYSIKFLSGRLTKVSGINEFSTNCIRIIVNLFIHNSLRKKI